MATIKQIQENGNDIHPKTSIEAVEGLGDALSKSVKTEGDQQVSGKKTFSAEIVSTSENFMRAKNNEYGVIFRRDNKTLGILLTNRGDPDGGWNDLRPFSINFATGDATLGTAYTSKEPSEDDYSTRIPSTKWVGDRIYSRTRGGSIILSESLSFGTNYLNDLDRTIIVSARCDDSQNLVGWVGWDDYSTDSMYVQSRFWDGYDGDGHCTLTLIVPPHKYYKVVRDGDRDSQRGHQRQHYVLNNG